MEGVGTLQNAGFWLVKVSEFCSPTTSHPNVRGSFGCFSSSWALLEGSPSKDLHDPRMGTGAVIYSIRFYSNILYYIIIYVLFY